MAWALLNFSQLLLVKLLISSRRNSVKSYNQLTQLFHEIDGDKKWILCNVLVRLCSITIRGITNSECLNGEKLPPIFTGNIVFDAWIEKACSKILHDRETSNRLKEQIKKKYQQEIQMQKVQFHYIFYLIIIIWFSDF